MRKSFPRLAFFVSLILQTGFSAYAQAKPGADVGAPVVAQFLASIRLEPGAARTLTEKETAELIALAAELRLNVFELLDGAYRYASRIGGRIVLPGNELRKAAAAFDMGGPRVRALLPIDKTERIEVGAVLASGQNAMDVYLKDKHSEFIELGTAVMESRFGFRRIAPKLFSEAYGVKVQRFPVSTELQKLELYAPAKGAIYVKALNRPKRWNLNIVTRLAGAESGKDGGDRADAD